MIHLESNFVQFKEELLAKEGNKALLTFPFLHVYWAECCVSTRPGDGPRACRGTGLEFTGLGLLKTTVIFQVHLKKPFSYFSLVVDIQCYFTLVQVCFLVDSSFWCFSLFRVPQPSIWFCRVFPPRASVSHLWQSLNTSSLPVFQLLVAISLCPRGHLVLLVLAFGFVFVTSCVRRHSGDWSALSSLVCRLSPGSGRALLPHGQCLSQVALGDCPRHEQTFLPSVLWPVLAVCVCVFLNPEVNFHFWQNSSVMS